MFNLVQVPWHKHKNALYTHSPHLFIDSERRGLMLSKNAFSSVSLIIRTAFFKSWTTSSTWSWVQWKFSYWIEKFNKQYKNWAPLLATLDTASFAGKSRMTSSWRGDFGFKRQRSALVGRTTNGALRNPKLECYWAFLISKREKSLISSFFISSHKKENERRVIRTVKLLRNNASVIIKLPRSLFIHTACKLKRERSFMKDAWRKKRS